MEATMSQARGSEDGPETPGRGTRTVLQEVCCVSSTDQKTTVPSSR
jgi:hypothetical protein